MGDLEEMGASGKLTLYMVGQEFSGSLNLDGIRKVKEAVANIPVIGNGDVTTLESARVMLERSGCDGVSMGRGAFYNPWIFKQTQHLLRTGEMLPEATFDQRVELMRIHLQRMIEFYGVDRGCVQFRKVAPWYAKRFGPSKYFKDRVVRFSSMEEFETILTAYIEWRAKFCDDTGELQERYRPPEQYSSITDKAPQEQIKVPKGPVSNW